MKSTFPAVAMVVVSIAVSPIAVGASQERIPELPRAGITDVKSITLTGCVERGTEIESYTLRETTEGATTTSTITPRLPVAISSTDLQISRHVGHRVSVTGSYAKVQLATGTAGGDEKTPRSFTVKSLKMLANSCEQATY